jgi:citrate lyase subunit beta/citryl-CoA lyase
MPEERGPRPLRSVLFFAGDEPDDYRDSERWGSDAVMIDLEEPRTPFPEDLRVKARTDVGAYLRSLPAPSPTRPLFFVRVRPVSTGKTIQDLSAVLCANLSGVLLPKVTSAADVIRLDGILTCLETDTGLDVGSTMIYPILETAEAVRSAYEIAMASARVCYMGGALARHGDLQQALGYRWTPEGRESLFFRSKVLLDARAAGVRYPISGMWAGRLDDIAGLKSFATELRDLGYYGMLLNSACTELVPYVHEIFTPSDDEVAEWLEVITAQEEAERTGGKVIIGERSRGEGHFIHGSQVKAAAKNLEWARALARRDGRRLAGDPAGA